VGQVAHTHEVLLSRPAWMWGCEMGVNERGVAVGNEAVFTRVPVATAGLTGMDLQRLALERAATAREALDLLTDLLARYAQGGAMGHRRRLRYHSSFLIADCREAWVLETAGRYWAAERVRGVRTLSNALGIGGAFDALGPGTFELARARGWCRSARDFDFARCFGQRLLPFLAGARQRRACTARSVKGRVDLATLTAALRDHGGRPPTAGWRAESPCVHATWLPTRAPMQTAGSMVARLEPGRPAVWFTATSAPCLSVFKPLPFGCDALPEELAGADGLWGRHERMHQTVLADFAPRSAAFADARADLEQRALRATGAEADTIRQLWREHHASIPAWTAQAAAVGRG
jgi:dipeptidase